jgi:ubiquinone/menaquinone biosynthesis C-methylase UbiE
MDKKLNKKHYAFSNYVNKKRWMSYYYQLNLIYQLNPRKILEVGVGDNFLKKNIRDIFKITTLDIDKSLNPDIIASVTDIPLSNCSFDLIVCFQVLEHLPLEEFPKAIKEVARISKDYVVISLPFAHHEILNFSISFFKKRTLYFKLRIPKFWKKCKHDGEHHWEIGNKSCSKTKIDKEILNYFIIVDCFIPVENSYHIFYILKKI